VDIIVGKILSAKKDGSNKHSVLPGGKKARFRERRKIKHDRRQSVREGIFVSLSFKNDRRVIPDRRKANLQRNSCAI
jgi:hypothetical protein